MKLSPSLLMGKFQRRYKRFFSDVIDTDDKSLTLIHTLDQDINSVDNSSDVNMNHNQST